MQVDKKESPQPLPPTVTQSVGTPAARAWLSNSAFGERASVVRLSTRFTIQPSVSSFMNLRSIGSGGAEGTIEVCRAEHGR